MLKSAAALPPPSCGFASCANTISAAATGRPSTAASARSASAIPARLARAASVPEATDSRFRYGSSAASALASLFRPMIRRSV